MPGSDPLPPSSDNHGITRQAGAPAGETEGVPAQLGPYRLIRKLGGGGMGQIFLAVQPNVGREVAIKVLPQGAIAGDEAVERFRREVHILGQLSHPNICPVLEAGEDRGILYYVMERLRGLDLARVLRTQRVDARRAAAVAIQVARALQCAHERGIVHRDVKPQNVMLLRGERLEKSAIRASRSGSGLGSVLRRLFGRTIPPGEEPIVGEPPEADDAAATDPSPEFRDHAVLIDFGLAREGGGAERLTMTGAVMGTPAYMAPEQARGDVRAIGTATDVYAAGALLYEMLTLQPPFTGETVGDVLERVRTSDPAPMRSLTPRIDAELETIVQKAMEKDPERRFASAAALAEDLERWRAGEPIHARRASLAYRVAKRVRRNPLASAALAALVSVMAAGMSYFLRPGEIELTGDVEGVEVEVAGRRKNDTLVRVWPARDVEVVVRLAGIEERQTVSVEPGKRTEVQVRLFGDLKVDTTPPGAEVYCDGVALPVRTPFTFPVLKGMHKLVVVLPHHEPAERLAQVAPGATVSISVPLDHQRGLLTLTSDPGELAVVLTPLAGGEPFTISSPAQDFPVPTGRYKAVARARNRFPRTFELEVARNQKIRGHISLPGFVLWQRGLDAGGLQWLAEDLNGDGRPEIVTVSKPKRRLWALNGPDGNLVWGTSHQDVETAGVIGLEAADLDGDLEVEVLTAAGTDGVHVREPVNGTVRRTIKAELANGVVTLGDWDGDAAPDLLLSLPSGLVAVSGRSGERLWRYANPGAVYVSPARLNGDDATDLVLGGPTDGVIALDGRTARELWRVPKGVVTSPTPVDANSDGIDDVFIYGEGDLGYRMLDGRTGADLWTIPAPAFSRPVTPIVGDLDADGSPEIVIASEHGVRVIDARSRAIEADLSMRAGDAPPALVDATGDGRPEILVPSGPFLVALDPVDWSEAWRFESDSVLDASPLLGDFDGDGRQDVAIRSSNGTVTVLSARPPPVVWRQDGVHDAAGGVVPLGSDRIFVPGLPHRVLRLSDGAVIAEASIPQGIFACVVRTPEGERLALEGAGRCRLLDSGTLETLWTADVEESDAPLLALDLNGDGSEDLVRGCDTFNGRVEARDGRTGAPLWRTDVRRVGRTSIAVADGILWIPSRGYVVGISAADGKEVGRVVALGDQASVVADGRDLYSGSNTHGRIAKFRMPKKGKKPKIEWVRNAAAPMTFLSPSVAGPLVVAASARGRVVALDTKTGDERWRTELGAPIESGPALADLDRDGFAEAAIACANGRVRVLRGRDGEVVWSWNLATTVGRKRALWHDTDHDGFPELLVPAGDSRVIALSTRRDVHDVLWRGRTWQCSAETLGSATATARRRFAIAEAARLGRWSEVVDRARGGEDPATASAGALAAARAGQGGEALRLADRARALGVRRLDIDAVRAAFLESETERAPALARALLEAPAGQLAGLPDVARPLLAQACALASAEASARGDWERAFAVCQPPFAWDAVARLHDHAAAAGVEPAILLVFRGRAATRFGRYGEARADFAAAGNSAQARVELAALDLKAEALANEALEFLWRNELGPAVQAALKAGDIGTSDPYVWRQVSQVLAGGQSLDPKTRTLAVEYARRALDGFDAISKEDLNTRSVFVESLAVAYFVHGEIARAREMIEDLLQQPLHPTRTLELKRLLEYMGETFK